MKHLKRNNLPLHIMAWLYNARRIAQLLIPTQRYPLADEHHQLASQPVFFISAGRSGTTLLRSLLVAGGEIAIPPQSFVLCYAALQFSAMQEQSWDNLSRMILSLFESHADFNRWELDMQPIYHRAFALSKTQRTLASLIDLLYSEYAAQQFSTSKRWGDQSIENTLQVQWLLQAFPKATYLHVLRDGRDVVASWVEQGKSVDAAINQWINALEKFQMIQRRYPSAETIEIRYEDLVMNTDASLEKLCADLSLSFSQDMLNFYRKDSTVEHKYDQKLHSNLAKPVFKKSVGSWQERLTPQQQSRVLERLSSYLLAKGYSI